MLLKNLNLVSIDYMYGSKNHSFISH
ncbi:hypothetical protein BN873_150322 [Candidatus Competibacter denitrificans Run_A_D11]|uniref:Uncharacterized protein n=1 Tax=Candidatus Competibacter denitrificans Run_A_D11 TaxID=1400863 RepID=W6M4I3_9GAMM|nr:hypothetical protein BN873_150322 [Candidatus Competibacter denitrificans Run_A_D11]